MVKNNSLFVKGIIYTNVVMFAASLLFSKTFSGLSANPLTLLSPGSGTLFVMGATGSIPVGNFNRWWTVVSAGFLHGGILHIFFNMAAFNQIAPAVTKIFGVWRMLAIYILGGILGFCLSNMAGVEFTIGASASVCSLLGTLLYYGKSRGDEIGNTIFRQVRGWVIGLVIFGFVIPGINNWAHGGGILGGIALGYVLGYEQKKPETVLHRALGAAGLILTAAVLVMSIGFGFSGRFL